jgi:hypothetical protein
MCLSSRGLVKESEEFRHFEVGNSCGVQDFLSWTFLHCYLVVYVVRICPWNFTFVDAQNSHWSICVCLGTLAMHCNNELVHMLNLLLFEGLGLNSLCLQRSALWG